MEPNALPLPEFIGNVIRGLSDELAEARETQNWDAVKDVQNRIERVFQKVRSGGWQ